MINIESWRGTIDGSPMSASVVHNLYVVAVAALDQADSSAGIVSAAGAWQANTDNSGRQNARDNLNAAALVISNHGQDPITEEDAEPFRNAVRQVFIEVNATSEAVGTQETTESDVPQIAKDAVADAPNVIGDSLGKIAAGAAGVVGNFSVSAILAFLKGLLTDPVGLLLVGSVGYIAYRRFVK